MDIATRNCQATNQTIEELASPGRELVPEIPLAAIFRRIVPETWHDLLLPRISTLESDSLRTILNAYGPEQGPARVVQEFESAVISLVPVTRSRGRPKRGSMAVEEILASVPQSSRTTYAGLIATKLRIRFHSCLEELRGNAMRAGRAAWKAPEGSVES